MSNIQPLPGIRILKDVTADTVSSVKYPKFVLPTCNGNPTTLNLTGEAGSMIFNTATPGVWVMTNSGWTLLAWAVL